MDKHYILVTLCAPVALAMLAGMYWIARTHHGNRALIIIHDQQLTLGAQERLAKSIHHALPEAANMQQLFTQLKQEFPTLESISNNTFTPGCVKLKLSFNQPLMLVQRANNRPLVLCKKGFYATPTDYRPELLQGLATLLTTEPLSEQDRTDIYQRIQQLPDHFFVEHTLQWNKPTEVIMRDRRYPDYDYIITASTAITPELQQKLDLVHKKIMEKKDLIVSKKKQNKKWKIDIRFKNQIIVKGGL